MTPITYSRTQLALHWIIALIVAFQLVWHDDIVRIWDGRMDGSLANAPTPNLHAILGGLIFVLVGWRLVLRLTRGVPPPPATEHPWLSAIATATHILFYVLLLGMPLSGAVAWLFGVETAAQVHAATRFVLVPFIGLHILAALAHHFWFKTDVLKRIFGRA